MRRNATLFVLISLLAGFGSTAMSISAGLWLLDLTHSVRAGRPGRSVHVRPDLARPLAGCGGRPAAPPAPDDRGRRRTRPAPGHAPDRPLGAGAWLIYAVLLARGISYGLLDAGETAILPAALPPSALGSVNGWRSSAQEGTKLLAPLAGAGLYAWQGPVPVILLCAAMPLATATCYALLRLIPAPAAPPRRGARRSAGRPTRWRLPPGRRPSRRTGRRVVRGCPALPAARRPGAGTGGHGGDRDVRAHRRLGAGPPRTGPGSSVFSTRLREQCPRRRLDRRRAARRPLPDPSGSGPGGRARSGPVRNRAARLVPTLVRARGGRQPSWSGWA